jgi:hypothetical protein
VWPFFLIWQTLFPEASACVLGATGDTIVVTGSIYLIGEVLERIQGLDSLEGSALNDKV